MATINMLWKFQKIGWGKKKENGTAQSNMFQNQYFIVKIVFTSYLYDFILLEIVSMINSNYTILILFTNQNITSIPQRVERSV